MKNVFFAAILLLAYLGWTAGSPYVFSEDFNVIVIQQAASQTCSEGLFHSIGKTRSEAPPSNVFGYCGAIITDHGAFDIVESGSFLIGAEERETIFDAMKPNCAVTIRASGFGDKPSFGDASTTGPRWMILSVDSAKSCP